MIEILAGTHGGCRVFTDTGESKVELAGKKVGVLAPEAHGAAIAIVEGGEIWRRYRPGEWVQVVKTDLSLLSIVSLGRNFFASMMGEATMVHIAPGEKPQRLTGFDDVPGRAEWFPQGPPLHVRALTATSDGSALLAVVHVGGIPRSSNGGKTWAPTIPVMSDVHDIEAHPSDPKIVAAAAAVGLCVSRDGGCTWNIFSEGFGGTTALESLAVAVLDWEVLFSVQEGGAFAKRSQVWRWGIGDKQVEQVQEELPEYLVGKIDTNLLAGAKNRAAVVDGGGNLWLSSEGLKGWKHLSSNLKYANSLLVV